MAGRILHRLSSFSLSRRQHAEEVQCCGGERAYEGGMPSAPSSAVAGRVGLRNLGNTCFMSAGLQCLSHIDPFAEYFLSEKYLEDLNRESTRGCGGELALAFAELQRTFWLGNQDLHNPRGLHAKMAKFAPHLFEGYDQQDVQEFLSFCLDGLHEDLNRVGARIPQTTKEQEADEQLVQGKGDEFCAALAWLRHLQQDKSFLVDLLQGQLASSLTCVRCGHRSRRFDPFLYLSVPVTRTMTKITDSIQSHVEEELLTGDEQWYCEKCKCKVDARKKIDLWKLPPVLVLHLKRFAFEPRRMRFKKIDALLQVDETVDLASFCSSAQPFGATYDVVCVANHSGPFGSGHYTATCRVGGAQNGRWFHFNDEQVTALRSGDQVVGREAYVVFLVRCQGDGQLSVQEDDAMVRRQTVTMPQLWPHWNVMRERSIQVLMEQLPASADGTPQQALAKSESDPAHAIVVQRRTNTAGSSGSGSGCFPWLSASGRAKPKE